MFVLLSDMRPRHRFKPIMENEVLGLASFQDSDTQIRSSSM